VIYFTRDFAENVFKEGVSGYILKDDIVTELPEAVRVVVSGREYFSRNLG